MEKKSIQEKYDDEKHVKVEILEKGFSDLNAGDKMFIASPKIIANYIDQIPKGKSVSIITMRKDIALEHNADNTCPLTTGIFLRIVAEKNYEDYKNGKKSNQLTPFWRVINPDSPLLKKLPFAGFITEQQHKEKLFTN
jgi:DeoR/GlpR family transcriptional regulator of sugar metabolism